MHFVLTGFKPDEEKMGEKWEHDIMPKTGSVAKRETLSMSEN